MNKQEAVKQLEALQAEVEKLKAIIERPDEPHVFQGRYLREGLGIGHWWLNPIACHIYDRTSSDNSSEFGLCFATEEDVRQHKEHLRLMQEARVAMAKSWGDVKVDWTNGAQYKYAVVLREGKPVAEHYNTFYSPIHFRTVEDRKKFFNRYSEEQLKLMIMGVQ